MTVNPLLLPSKELSEDCNRNRLSLFEAMDFFLISDLRNMKTESHKYGVEGDPRGDNLFVWVSYFRSQISIGECNTIVSAYTLYRHLE